MNLIRLAIMFLIFIFILGSTQSLVFTVGNRDANYTSIQTAIDEASPGDIIEVKGGIYNENVTINKMLILHGINGPVIDSRGKGSPVSLTCGGTVLEGFNLINSSEYESGINILFGPDWFSNSLNNSGVTIRYNLLSNNYDGITIEESPNNIIERNIIKNNRNVGLNLKNSMHNMLKGNTIANNSEGISLIASTGNVIEDNSLFNNSGNGISLVSYLSEYGPYGYSDNNIVSGNELVNNEKGIFLAYAERNNISHNKLIDNGYGIYLQGSLNNSVFNNDYFNNTLNNVSGNQSRNEMHFRGNFLVSIYNAFSTIALVFISFGIVFGLIVGIVTGLILERVIRRRSLSLIGNAVIGMIGFNVGFYGSLLLTSDLSIAFIIAVLAPLILILLIIKIKSPQL